MTTTPTQQPLALQLADRQEMAALAWVADSQPHKFRLDTAAELRRQHAEIARLTAENEALLDRFAKQLIPLTPGQCVDIADVAAKLEFSDNFLSDICKIVEMVEVAHGIGEKP